MDIVNIKDDLEKNKKELNKLLKSLFSGQIKINFMLEIMYLMIALYPDLIEYTQSLNDFKDVLSGKTRIIFYILCEHIVGVHRSKTIFLSDSERSSLEENAKYRSELMDDVYKEIKLRPEINFLLRSEPLIKGDKFIYFPVPYYLAVLETRFLQLANKSKEIPGVYFIIASKTLAVLSLLQDNFCDCTYSMCRIIIEEYFRGTIFHNCREAINEYIKFTEYELNRSLKNCYDEEFLYKFDNRLNQKSKNKVDYLHYGWVDVIPGYHNIVKQFPYTLGGIKQFIIEKFANDESKQMFELLGRFHNMCNGYVHGSIISSKYPLLHYFEICAILANTTVNAYYALCQELGETTDIGGVDVIVEIKKHLKILLEADSKKSTKNFENYYKNLKIY